MTKDRRRYNIAIAGFGGVGKVVADLLLARQERYRELYDADVNQAPIDVLIEAGPTDFQTGGPAFMGAGSLPRGMTVEIEAIFEFE